MTILYVILAILIFGVLIFVHEFGHFTAAKACGVRVDEFAIGMGPAIWQKKKGETTYSLRCVPMGGYCAMAGEDEKSEDPRAFTNQNVWKRLVILVAGAAMNFLLGFVIVLLLYSNADAFHAPVIAGFFEGCPYEGEDAFLTGDRILSVDGHRIFEYYDISDFLSQGDGDYDIVLLRGGKRVRLDGIELVKRLYPGETTERYGFYLGYDEADLKGKMSHSWNSTMQFGRMVWMGLGQLFSGEVGVDDMSGPVGIVDMMAETGKNAASAGDALYEILYISAFIAVNLAMVNMLPIPALDGGRVFTLLITGAIESVTHKRLDPRYEGFIHAAGMALLLALMAFVMFNDIVRIVTK